MSDQMQKPVEVARSDVEGNEAPDVTSAATHKTRFVEDLYKSCWKELCTWLRGRYGAGPPEPEDIAQSAFEHIAALDRVDHIQNPRAYLYTVASRAALMGVRWLIRNRKFIPAELSERDMEVEKITPERLYMDKERFDRMLDRFDRLTDKQKEIITRSRIQGQTYQQISAETGWSLQTISRHLRAALQFLRTSVDDERNTGADR